MKNRDMFSFIFRVALDRDCSDDRCGACARPLTIDVEDDLRKDSSYWCDCYDQPVCNCPAYFHRFTFTRDADMTHIKIETNIENKGARRRIVRLYDSVEFDFVSSSDDSDLTIFAPHVPLLKQLFIDHKTNDALIDLAGRMRSKRLSIDDGAKQLKNIRDEICAHIITMFSKKCSVIKHDIYWIGPMAKALTHAIVGSAPSIVEHKDCIHIGIKKKKV